MLELHELKKYFGGVKAVDGVSFTVNRGEIVGLIGPNGSGKSTIFNVISGLYAPTGGTLRFEGREISRLGPEEVCRRGIARTFQNIRLFNKMTALDNVIVAQQVRVPEHVADSVIPLARTRKARARVEARARELLEFVGLSEVEQMQARNLPYGKQRRLEIARALGTDPKLLLLDEPVAGMNPAEAQEMMALFRRMRDSGVTILLVEHSMKVVMNTCDRVVVLDYGRLVTVGEPHEVQADPAVIEIYLGKRKGEAVARG